MRETLQMSNGYLYLPKRLQLVLGAPEGRAEIEGMPTDMLMLVYPKGARDKDLLESLEGIKDEIARRVKREERHVSASGA